MPREKRKSQYSLALEQVQTEEPLNSQPVERLDSQPVEYLDSQPTKQPASKTAKQQRIKATFYLSSADIIAIDKMQIARFEKNGKKPEKSELVSEAIQLLFSQRDS